MPPFPSIRTKRSVLAALSLALAISWGVLSCGAKVERLAPSRRFVEATLPGRVEEILVLVHTLFRDGLAPRSGSSGLSTSTDHFARCVLFPRRVPQGYGFVPLPEDFDLRRNTRGDPAVERYLRLPADRRDNDLFLYCDPDYFWLSEYQVRGRPALFTCHFILHFEPADQQRTRVEILEYQPLVRAGRKLDVAGHGVGFGWMDDLRLVPPTTRDRVEVLARIERGARTKNQRR